MLGIENENMKYKYLATINLISIIMYKADKMLANSTIFKFRIAEKYLLFLSLLGGSPGSLFSIYLFKHKNKKFSFLIATYAILFGQIYCIHEYTKLNK